MRLDRDEFLVIDVGADDQHFHAECVEQSKPGWGQAVAGRPGPVRFDLFEAGQAGVCGTAA